MFGAGLGRLHELARRSQRVRLSVPNLVRVEACACHEPVLLTRLRGPHLLSVYLTDAWCPRCVHKSQREPGVPAARPPVHRTICAINGYFIYIVRIVPRVCLHQRLAVRAAVFGQRITLMQGELGGGEGGAVGNWAPGAAWGGPPGKREQASPGLDL